ncbi:hypothetical protein R6Q57_004245 [Mikania cordata]
MNPCNTPGYRPQMSSPNQPNFYYEQMNPSQYLQYSSDDSDSSEHNKSVQVESEEEEEPVTDHFHQLMKDNSRTLDQIYSKWNDLNSAMKKWNSFYQQASMNHKSGEGDEHVLKKSDE